MEHHKQRQRGRRSCEGQVSQLGLGYRVCGSGAEPENERLGLYRGRGSYFILVATGSQWWSWKNEVTHINYNYGRDISIGKYICALRLSDGSDVCAIPHQSRIEFLYLLVISPFPCTNHK